MSLLLRVIKAAHCRSTHHFMAIDALNRFQGQAADAWAKVFLHHYDSYLSGAKAPDTDFKDFRNHVLHVSQDNWGGAVTATQKWYDRSVDLFKRGHWAEAVYAAGVMTHYYTDPIQPFHTGQSEAESNIHRAAEWSITKSYEQICEVMAGSEDLPTVEQPTGKDWLEKMVIAGARYSHQYYHTLIDEYDFRLGKSDPPAGLNAVSRSILAKLIHFATEGTSIILEAIIRDAAVAPMPTTLTLATFVASLEMPIRYVTKKMGDAQERSMIAAMYDEFHRTGKVSKLLPAEQRVIKKLVQQELGHDAATAASPSLPSNATSSSEEGGRTRVVGNAAPRQVAEAELPPVGARSTEQTIAALRRKFGGKKTAAEKSQEKLQPKKKLDSQPTVRTQTPEPEPVVRKQVETAPQRPTVSETTSANKLAQAEYPRVHERVVTTSNQQTVDLQPTSKAPAQAATQPKVNDVAETQEVDSPASPVSSSPSASSTQKLSKKQRKQLARQRQAERQKESDATPADSAKAKPKFQTLDLNQSLQSQLLESSSPVEKSSEDDAESKNSRSDSASTAAATSNKELRFYLQTSDEVEDGPSIGPKTGARLRKIGIRTVSDLLAADVDEAARKIEAKHIRASTLADWQDQARLVCRIPQLRGHDAQILVACGYRSAEAVAMASAEDLYLQSLEFSESNEGVRVLRGSNPPDEAEIKDWIRWARQSRSLKAA